jgi:hypothetical protein
VSRFFFLTVLLSAASWAQPSSPTSASTSLETSVFTNEPDGGGLTDGGVPPDAGADSDGGARPEAAPSPTVATPLDGGTAPAGGEFRSLSQNKAVPKNFTGVIGRVTDSRSGDGLIEATVKVVAGGKKTALTDVDGYYRMKLPAGTYDLRVYYELYQARRLSNVQVSPNQAVVLDVSLESDARAVQEVLVEAKADSRKESALLQERKKAAQVQDSIGAQEIARTPDSNAGDAVKRVVSATVVDGKYVFLRGLGGRYALTLLNGTIMPSPEPDEPSAPLDLFPVALVSNLNVVKTYSPELPGTFGGGALTIETNTFPTTFEVRARAQLAGDTQTTFQTRPSEPATLGEQLGFRSSSRDLPRAFSRTNPLRAENDPARGASAEQIEAAGEALENRWLPREVSALPSGTFGLQLGDTVRFKGDRKVGYLLAAQVSRRELTKRISFQDNTLEDEALVGVNQTTTEVGSVSGATSGLANVGVQLGRDHELNWLTLALVNAETTATESSGRDFLAMQDQVNDRLQFTQRQLFFNQLKGFHRLGTGAWEIDWQGNYSHVTRLDPDIRDTRFFVDPDGVTRRIRLQPNSGERFFLTLDEDSGGASLNLTIPYRSLRLRFGGLAQHSARLFDGRRFRYYSNGRLAAELQTLPPEELFVPSRIGPQPDGYDVFLAETTVQQDRYASSLSVWAGYGLLDWKAADWVRGIVGVRYEGARQTLDANSPFATGGPPPPIARQSHDVLPSANVVFTPSSSLNVRVGYAYTLARPTFRELGPFLFFDIVRRRNVSGNPALETTHIHHADVRAEWFPSEGEVLAVSAFGKQFVKPIERVVVGSVSNDDFSFRNADGASLLGLEFEARASLGRLSHALREVKLGANVSFIHSRIQLAEGTGQLGSADRPLQGQSPYVANANLTWSKPEWGTEAGVFYNVYGPRISEVAVAPQPDFVERPFHRLDVTVSQSLGHGLQLKASAANLLNQSVRIMKGDIEVLRIPPGLQFSLGLSWNMTPTERKSK